MPGPHLTTLRNCQDRVLEREGIPMVLALVNEAGPQPAVASAAARDEGEGLAAAMDAYRENLLPDMRDADNGCLISVLQAVSFVDFAGPAEQVPADAHVLARNEVGA